MSHHMDGVISQYAERLVDLGFDEGAARQALYTQGGDYTSALTELETNRAATTAVLKPVDMEELGRHAQHLVTLGYDLAHARQALENHRGDEARAVQELESEAATRGAGPPPAADDDNATAGAGAGSRAAGGATAAANIAPGDSLVGKPTPFSMGHQVESERAAKTERGVKRLSKLGYDPRLSKLALQAAR